MTDETDQVLRWYTPAMRIPLFVGKLPSGERIWGGPYTAAQGAVFAVVLVLGLSTRGLWGGLVDQSSWGGLATYAVIILVAAVAGFAARYVPRTTMNPVAIAAGAVSVTVPRRGTGRGRRGPAPVRSRVTITEIVPRCEPGRGAPRHLPPPAVAGEATPLGQIEAQAVNVSSVGAKLAALVAAGAEEQHA